MSRLIVLVDAEGADLFHGFSALEGTPNDELGHSDLASFTGLPGRGDEPLDRHDDDGIDDGIDVEVDLALDDDDAAPPTLRSPYRSGEFPRSQGPRGICAA